MERSDCHIQLKPHTRHLVIQDLLIYYVFKRRIRQIEALAVCSSRDCSVFVQVVV